MLTVNKGNYHSQITNIPMRGSFGGYELEITEDMGNMTLNQIAEKVIQQRDIKVGEIRFKYLTFGMTVIHVEELSEEQLESLKSQGCEF